MSSKIGSISEESKILHEIKPRIDSLILEISQEISKEENDKFFNQEISLNEETNNTFAYFILEILWLYEIIRKENKKIKLSKGLNKDEIVKDIEILKNKYGFKIFPINLITKLPHELVKKTILSLESIEDDYAKKGNVDLRGVIFQNLLPEELRKVTGSYHTRSDAAEILASISINDGKSTVLDLSCGSGKLLVASNHRIKKLQKKESDTLNQIFGIDLMQIPSCLAVINLYLENLNVNSNVNIGTMDSLDLEPETLFSPLKSIDSEIKLPKVDVVIMNPPFTRQESLEKEQKERYISRFSKYNLVDKRIGLHGYFILLGNEFLKEGGTMSLVLPATVLRIESFTRIRQFLVENFQIKYLIVSNKSSSFSYGSRFREILLVCKKEKPKKSGKVRIAVLNEKPVMGVNVEKIISTLTKKILDSSNTVTVIDIEQELFAENYLNLFKFISLSKDSALKAYSTIFLNNDNLIKIRDYCENNKFSLIRGWETLRSLHPVQSDYILLNKDKTDEKSQWFFVKKEKAQILIQNSQTNEQIKIPTDSIKFGLRRLGDIDTINADEKLDYVVCKKFKDISKFLSKPVIENFSEWERIIQKKSSRLAFVRRFSLAGKTMRLCAIVASDEFTPTQTMSIITQISAEDAKILSLWLNSSLHILQMIVERVETEGAYMELPEWAMKELLIINPKILSKIQRKQILAIYEKIQNVSFPPLSEQFKNGFDIRNEIDQMFLDILKIHNLKVEDLQKIVKEEINDLRFLVKSND